MPNLLPRQTHLTPVLQGLLFSISCLLAPHALANPMPTGSLSPAKGLISNSDCLPPLSETDTGTRRYGDQEINCQAEKRVFENGLDLSVNDRPIGDISLPETIDESSNSSVPPTPNLDRPCPVAPPTANAPNQSPRENEEAENQVVPTRSCSADLMEVSSPIGTGEQGTGVLTFADPIAEKFLVAGEPIPATETTIAQENSQEPPSETAPEVSPSSNEETQTVDESDRWHFKFQPYGTIPVTVYGNATVKGRTVNYHLGLGELLDVLRFTASGRFEAWKGNLGFIVDAYYASLQGSGIKNSRRLPETNLEAVLKFDQGIYDFAFSYHFGDSPAYSLPEKPSNKAFPLVWFEPIAGVRLNDLSSSVETTLNIGRFDRTFEKTFNAGRTWFEPMVGGKLGVQISDPVTFWVRGDVSGFGLAGDTDLSWNIFAGVDWWTSRNISLQLAYRFYQIKYGNGSGKNAFGFEENFNGPVIAATFHF